MLVHYSSSINPLEINPNLKDTSPWAVVVNGRVIDTHIGHPDQYSTNLFDEVSLVQFSHDRGFPAFGWIWDGYKFRKEA